MEKEKKIPPKLIKSLQENGYINYKIIPSKGVCALLRFAFTTGLVYGIDETGYVGRYCFESMSEANDALSTWDGIGDPSGNWIKHKGDFEYSNPKYEKTC